MKIGYFILFIFTLLACQGKMPPNYESDVANIIVDSLQVQWLKHVKTTGRISSNHYSDFVVDSNHNSYIACFATGPDRVDYIYIVKISAEGETLWELNKNKGRACAIAIDREGNIWVTGYYIDHIQFDEYSKSGGSGVFLAKFNKKGQCLQLITGEGGGIGFNCHVNNAGEVIISGVLDARLRFGDQEIINVEKNVNNFIALFDRQGNCKWIRKTEGNINRIISDENGDFYLAGTFSIDMKYNNLKISTTESYDNDAFLLKINTQGKGLWLQQFGNPGITRSAYRTSESGFDLMLQPNGNIIVIATTEEPTKIDDLLQVNNNINVKLNIVEFNPNGVLIKERIIAQNIRESTMATLCRTSDGSYYISFTTNKQSKIGDQTFQFDTDRHGVIAAFDQNWNLKDILYSENNEDVMFRESYALDSCVYFTGHFRGDFILKDQKVNGSENHSLFLLNLK